MKVSSLTTAADGGRPTWAKVGTHTHLVRNIDAGDDVSLANLLAWARETGNAVVVCGSLFLAGEALAELGYRPFRSARFTPNEMLRPKPV